MYRLERKKDALEVGYYALLDSQVKDRMDATVEDFVARWEEVDTWAVTFKGNTVGCIILHNDLFIHVAIERRHRKRWGVLWPEIYDYLVDTYDELIGLVHVENIEANSVMESAGFDFWKTEDKYNWWVL